MTSGIGQHHTNEPNKANRKDYLTISWGEITTLVDTPQMVDKTKSQWALPSSYPSRAFKEQEQHGQYFYLWADLDKRPPPIEELSAIIKDIIQGDYEIYNTSSATLDNQKARILIPLLEPLIFADWTLSQQILNDKLEALGIVPDRTNERAAQVCYLPNKGKLYKSESSRQGVFFNALNEWSDGIAGKVGELVERQAIISKAKQEALEKRSSFNLGDVHNPMKAFNLAYTPAEILLNAGYAQKGNKFCHPNSETGNYSASLLNGRVNTLSSNDPLYTGGEGAHDAFSCFTVLCHGGDIKAALIDAGDNFLTIGSVSFNKAAHIEWAKNKAKQQQDNFTDDSISFDEIPDFEETTEGQEGYKQGYKNQNQTAFKLVSANELMNRKINHDWQIKGLFEHGNLGQIFGATGAGKSFVVLDMAYCIASGIDYHGRETKQGNVVYICGEGFSGLSRRFHALQNKYEKDIVNKLFISEQPAAFMETESTASVYEAVAAVGDVSLVIIDTYHRNMGGGDENSANDFAIVLNNMAKFLKPLGVTIIIIHHSGHMETGRARGSSSIRAAMDFEYQASMTANGLTLKNTKMKDATAPDPILFDFIQVSLGEDEDGEPITSAYLEAKDINSSSTGKRAKRKLNARDEVILSTLVDALNKSGIDPTAEIKAKYGGFDSMVGKHQKIVLVDDWRELAYKAMATDSHTEETKAQAKKKAFKRCKDMLFNNEYTIEHGDYVWRYFEDN
jgi:hypothetical protein